MAFDGVRVPTSHLVGNEGEGMTFAYEWFRFERLMVAARCLGAAERLLDEASDFAHTRLVGGEPLDRRQLVQAMLADSVTELFAARSMVVRDARAGSTPARTGRYCTPAARWSSCTRPRWPDRVADRAVQIFGGRGYMRENVAERFYRELRVERIWEGASEVQRLIIADQLSKQGLGPLIR